jgi:hypothetical protein
VTSHPLHLAPARDGAGHHPAAWREPDAEQVRLLDPRRWADVVREAEAVTHEPAITTIIHEYTDRVRSYELLTKAWGAA